MRLEVVSENTNHTRIDATFSTMHRYRDISELTESRPTSDNQGFITFEFITRST